VIINLKGQNTLSYYLLAVESDCESDSMGVGGGEPKTKEEKQEQERAVFTTGSFSAYVHLPSCLCLGGNDGFSSWQSLFFYRCTDTISFAPLRSQGVDSRLNYIRGGTTTAAPPPCSPKSIYVLANYVRRPSIKRLTHDTNALVEAGNTAPL
jgi:hypothetical protein